MKLFAERYGDENQQRHGEGAKNCACNNDIPPHRLNPYSSFHVSRSAERRPAVRSGQAKLRSLLRLARSCVFQFTNPKHLIVRRVSRHDQPVLEYYFRLS